MKTTMHDEFVSEAVKTVEMGHADMDGYFDDFIQRVELEAIAEHEASKWKKYPENKPEIGQKCLITFWDGEVAVGTIWGKNAPWDEDNVIAFRELPEPYQEGGER